MKGIYLGAYRAAHNVKGILLYQDINGLRDVGGDMLNVDLKEYDYVIATPPCNFWSIANYRRYESGYALMTRHLLPCILLKLLALGKPFIVENVRNDYLMSEYYLFKLPVFIYNVGRHTYWSNLFLPLNVAEQEIEHISKTPKADREGGQNVHNVIDIFLDSLGELKK